MRGQKAGCASTQVNGVENFRGRKCTCGFQVFCEPVDVALHVGGRKYTRSEVAIGTLRAAKRHGDVETKGVHGDISIFACWRDERGMVRTGRIFKLESNCVPQAGVVKRSAGSAEHTRDGLQSLRAAADPLPLLCREEAARVYGLAILGQARAFLWRPGCARAAAGACAGRTWVKPHRAALYRRWFRRFSLSCAARSGLCFPAAFSFTGGRNEAARHLDHKCGPLRSAGKQTFA